MTANAYQRKFAYRLNERKRLKKNIPAVQYDRWRIAVDTHSPNFDHGGSWDCRDSENFFWGGVVWVGDSNVLWCLDNAFVSWVCHRRRRWGQGSICPLKIRENIFPPNIIQNSGIFWQMRCKIRDLTELLYTYMEIVYLEPKGTSVPRSPVLCPLHHWIRYDTIR